MEKYKEPINDLQNNLSDYIFKSIENNIKSIKSKKIKLILTSILKIVKFNKNLISIIIIALTLYYSYNVINFIQGFMLFDSIILSLLILKNNYLKKHARRLSKNVICLFILFFNLTGSLISLIIVFMIYYEFNKYINKMIYKIVELLINFVSNNIPFIKYFYNNLNLIDYNTNIESTESSKSSSDSESDSENENINKNIFINEQKMYKKLKKYIDKN
jgi:hypothetical protein